MTRPAVVAMPTPFEVTADLDVLTVPKSLATRKKS